MKLLLNKTLFKILILFSIFITISIDPLYGQRKNLINPDDINWSKKFAPPGLNGTATELGTIDLNTVCYTGNFSKGDGITYLLAIWDGENWSIEGPGPLVKFPFSDGTINTVVGVGTNIYIGGDFNMIGQDSIAYIAMWDGNQWHSLGEGVNGPVESIASTGNNDIYVGGTFTSAGGDTVNNVAKWNGSSWEALTEPTGTSNGVNGSVLDITVSNNAVFLGGKFTHATGVPVNYIAKWNWTTHEWSDLNGGVNFWVYSVAAFNSGVVAGGAFSAIGGETYNYIAYWDGSGWMHLGSGSSTNVFDVEVSASGGLYANGNFSQEAGSGASQLAMWQGGQWIALGNPQFYAGGSTKITTADNLSIYILTSPYSYFPSANNARGILFWNGNSWSGMGSGIGPMQYSDQIGYHVKSLGWDGSNVYAGGNFKTAGDDSIKCLVKLENNQWISVGQSEFKNINPNYEVSVNKINFNNNKLYAAGRFDSIGNIYARNIAVWDGSSWSSLNGGVGDKDIAGIGKITAMHIANGNIFVGGSFNEAGNTTVRNAAVWNGTNWDSVGGGVFPAAVDAITHIGNYIYFGGGFSSAGNQSVVQVNMIAKWDGSSWSDVGGGVSQGNNQTWVHALAVTSNGDLIVGGEFTMAGSVPANNIARWDGANWYPLGNGIDGIVYSIYCNGNDIYAGGTFYQAGNDSIQGIAKWDGSNWQPLGSGIPIEQSFSTITKVLDIIGTTDGIYAGGQLKHAGKNYSNEIALWSDFVLNVNDEQNKNIKLPDSFSLSQNYPNPFNPSTNIGFRISEFGFVTLKVYNILGKEITTLVSTELSPGSYNVKWNASNYPSGIYFYKITADKYSQTRKMILLK